MENEGSRDQTPNNLIIQTLNTKSMINSPQSLQCLVEAQQFYISNHFQIHEVKYPQNSVDVAVSWHANIIFNKMDDKILFAGLLEMAWHNTTSAKEC